MRGRIFGLTFYVSVFCVLGLAIAGITTYVYADVGIGQACHCVSSPPDPAKAEPEQITLSISLPAILDPLSGMYSACPGALMCVTASGGNDTDWLLNGNLPNIDGICTSYYPLYIRVCCNGWNCFPNYNCPGSDKTTTCHQIVSNADKDFSWMSTGYIIGRAVDMYSPQHSRCYIEVETSDHGPDGQIATYRPEATTHQETTPSKGTTIFRILPTRSGVSVCAHVSLGLTQSSVNALLRDVEEQVFLKDEYGEGIIGRYNDNTDTHCCKGVFCTSFSTFTDNDVMPGGSFRDIDNEDEYNIFTGNWSNPNKKKQVVITSAVLWHPMTGGVVGGMATMNGYQIGGNLYLSNSAQDKVRTFAHEWGHYKGNLSDEYVCGLCQNTPSVCGCVCPQGKTRGQHPGNPPDRCSCGYFQIPGNGFISPPTNNFMTQDGRGVRSDQCPTL